MRFIKDTLSTFSTKIVGVVLGLVATIIIARVLGPEGKGAYTLIILIPSMLVLLGNLGIGTGNIYFGGSQRHNWNELASNSLISALMLGIPLTVVFLSYYFIGHPAILNDLEPGCVVLAALTIPMSLLATYFSSILLGQHRIREYNMVYLLNSVVFIALTSVLLVLQGGIFGVIVAWTSAISIMTLLSFMLVQRTTTVRWAFYALPFKDSIRLGAQAYLGDIIQFLNYRLDMLLIAFFMSATFVGYYSIAVTLAEALWYLPGSVGVIIVARTSGLSKEELNRTTPQICRNTLFITILCALALAVLGKPIITLLFGSAFLPALEPLWVLLPGIVAFSICKVLSNEIIMRGKPIINIIAVVISLVINASLNILLIPRMGISGAALASTISYSVTASIVLGFYLRISRNRLFDTIIVKPGDLRAYSEALANWRTIVFKKDR